MANKTTVSNDQYHYHTDHVFMAQHLRLVGRLPAAERRAFVQGMLAVVAKWLNNEGDRKKTGWPKPPVLRAKRAKAGA